MASDAQAPERLRIVPSQNGKGRWRITVHPLRNSVEYIRADALPGTVEDIWALMGAAREASTCNTEEARQELADALAALTAEEK